MKHNISYTAANKRFSFYSQVTFNGHNDNDVARSIYLAVMSDSRNRIKKEEIPTEPSNEEASQMSDEQLEEWYKTVNIEFVDEKANKILRMKHMSDFMGGYIVEQLNSK